MKNILKITDLNLRHRKSRKCILKSISLNVKQHRILGIIGESGSGKSMLARSIIGITPESLELHGEIEFKNRKLLLSGSAKNYDAIRGKEISIIFQNGYEAFNPVKKLGTQFEETIKASLSDKHKDVQGTIHSALIDAELAPPDFFLSRYPHQLSGGQLQRMMIAMSMMQSPSVVIADEPTTALDPITQFEIIESIKKFVENKSCTLIFISHDIRLVGHMSDEMIVMKEGEIVEVGNTVDIINDPQEIYTKSLIHARNFISSRFMSVYKND